MPRVASGSHVAGAEPAVRGFAVELKTSLPVSLLTTITGTGITSSEAFGAGAISKRLVLTATALASDEAFGSSSRSFPKGAVGTHPSTTDTRTTVTGPADLSGKNFTNPVTLTGSGITGIGVAFAKKPTFQDVTADLRNVWFDQDGSAGLASIVGSAAATNVTIRAFTALQFKGDMADVDGALVGTVGFYNGFVRSLPQSVVGLTTLTGVGLTSNEVFGSSSVSHKNVLTASGIPSSEAFGGSSVLGVGGPDVVTPAAHGPTRPIVTTLSAATPAYTVQVTAAGTLKRSDTGATITIAGTEFTGGTLLIASDTPGTRRTIGAGALSNVRVRGGKMILRDVTTTSVSGEFEITDSSSDFVLELQGWNGVLPHWRGVNCTGGGLRATKSPSGLYPGQNSPAAGTWQAYDITNPAAPVPTPAGRIDNFTLHAAAGGATGPALLVDAGLNIVFGGFDPGTQSTPAGKWPLAVKLDAASRSGGTKVDVQDVYIGAALDGTTSKMDATSGNYRVWAGVLKRSGIDSAIFPNTAGSRPEKPIWFALSNAITPGSETSANTTNDRVVAEHFVLREAFAQNLVNATARDGSTKLQVFEITKTVYDPAVALSLWTPSDVSDVWPNGARRFIHPNAVKGPIGARPSVAAVQPNGLPIQTKMTVDSTWTGMGGIAGDGVLEIIDRVLSYSTFADGTTTATKRFKSTIGTGPNSSSGGGKQLAVRTATALNSSTGTTLLVKNVDGSAVTAGDFAAWTADGSFALYSGYFDPAKPDEVETGVPYRRQLSFTGIDTAAGAFLGVKVIPRPTTTPAEVLPDGKIIRIVAGVAETFHPHGMPTGDLVDIATPALTGTNYTVTRVDDYHFLINGQTAINWAGPAVWDATFTPKTAHAYGLAGTDNSFTIGVGATLDDAANSNMGQPINNLILLVKAGLRVRLIRCTLGDLSLQAAAAADSSGNLTTIELVDCDMPVTGVPGRYAYDKPARLGVAGKYDPANQHVLVQMLYSNNAIVPANGSLWFLDGVVAFGIHGDFCQGTFANGSYARHCHIEHGTDVGFASGGGAATRAGIPGTLPLTQQGVHGDIQQWYDKYAYDVFASAYITNAHSIHFSRVENNYDNWGMRVAITGAANNGGLVEIVVAAQTWLTGDVIGTVDNAGVYAEFTVTKTDTTHFKLQGTSGAGGNFVGGRAGMATDGASVIRDSASGNGRVTMRRNHGMNTGDTALVTLGTDGILGEHTVTKLSNTVVLLDGTNYTGATDQQISLSHTIHIKLKMARTDYLTSHLADASNPDRLSPVFSDGNVSMSIDATGLSRGSPKVAIDNLIPGEIDTKLEILDSRIQTIDGANGTWLLATPLAAADLNLGDGMLVATGSCDPQGLATSVFVDYGTDPDNLNLTAAGPTLAGSGQRGYSVTVKGLAEKTVYYFRTRFVSSQGTSVDTLVPQQVRVPPVVAGATKHVATTGNDTTGTGAVGAPYLTIQKALSTCSTTGGDQVLVHAGNYASQAGASAIAKQFTGLTVVRDASDGAVHLASVQFTSARKIFFEGNIDVDGHGLADAGTTLLFEAFGSGPSNKAQDIYWSAGDIGNDSMVGSTSSAPVALRLSSDLDGLFIHGVRLHGTGFSMKSFAATTPTTSYPTRIRLTGVECVGNSWDVTHPGQTNDMVWIGGSLHDINAAFSTSPSEEHHDAIQVQNGSGMKWVGIRIYDHTHTIAAGDGSAILLNNDTGGSLSNIKMICCVLESWPGAGINVTNGSTIKFLQITIGNCPGAGHPQGTVINDADVIISAAASSVTLRGINARKQYFDSGAPTATIDKNIWRVAAVRAGTNSKSGSVAFVSTTDLHLGNSTQAAATGGPTPADDADVLPFDFDGRGFGPTPAIGAYAAPNVTTPLPAGPATLALQVNRNAWYNPGQQGTAVPSGTAKPTLL